ncbi:MAG: carbamoyl-phosphate synthase large subunit [Alphaproteobacteria bacterium]|nr:carbamoyl-phosphate synthase large subunit [Alphaproteobacteria bacterium]MDA8004322.1 carbamoyl-phosphate synthase large subunit [Alphaproteobacteria bacterium]MDA8006255.1 carbamoyl-phosphate synthase large subunit [Alphaproteobacteria bacterium]MDA8013615.1 carbamoyl-phosphate synthase large subunit [Alphaproteobacteria bacterium]
MPKRTDIETILVLGAGPIVIGQACEFDYSGVQACRTLKEEGYRVVLINSNPATVMTDPELADATYIEPLTAEIAERVIAREKPDALLPTMGGQTALNLAMRLHRDGHLERRGVELIGARADAIARAEDRELFRQAMSEIGIRSSPARIASGLEEAMAALDEVGLPVILRPSFTLGGRGGGVAYNREEFPAAFQRAREASPIGTVLVEKSVIGWKEYELEVIRDIRDNCIIVCSIENIDPMGIHTGDSVTVAPAMTLTDKEYQQMRDAAIACLRRIGVETGGSNVQFAVNPRDGEMLIIEMNPRVSRSSALASKATGFPIARVATRLAVGYTLDEIRNEVSGTGPASFEPALDWVVVKTPRFDFEKFHGAEALLTSSMKSVGEAMSVGGTFPEALQKAYASLEIGLRGLESPGLPGGGSRQHFEPTRFLGWPVPGRLLFAAEALRRGIRPETITRHSGFDPWHVARLEEIVRAEGEIASEGLPEDAARLRRWKHLGFTDARLAALAGRSEDEVRARRHALGLHPSYRRIDTSAGEFPSETPYLYSAWDAAPLPGADEAEVSDRRKVMILGGGPNRIGQGIEFDYCCVHAVQALRALGIEAIMVNCNPETVSTDYDTADRLYFEPLTAEHVLEIARRESSRGELLGALAQFGGQTPLRIARALEAAGLPVLGTSAEVIDIAEDRDRFHALLKSLNLRQPEGGVARATEEAVREARRVGYPVLLRPSYVLGGRAMRRVENEDELVSWIDSAVEVSGEHPVLIDSYIADAIEVDVDALCDGRRAWVAGAMEHVEEAGVHSGDSASSFPHDSLESSVIDEIHEQSRRIGEALGVVGLFNVQFACRGDEIYVLEVNPRASRTVPFLTKALGLPLARYATRLILGETLDDLGLPARVLPPFHAVKEAIFPFDRFEGADAMLGPEMRSTGEVMGIDRDFASAFWKAQLALGLPLPGGGGAFISVNHADRAEATELAREFASLGFSLLATSGTAGHFESCGLEVEVVPKVYEGRRPHVMDRMLSGDVALVLNTPSGRRARGDSDSIRSLACARGIPCFTTLRAGRALVRAMRAAKTAPLEVCSLQDYFSDGEPAGEKD